MARRSSKSPSPVMQLLHTAQSSMKDAERALTAGDCGEAADSLMHAYRLKGTAEGYVIALREAQGRHVGFGRIPRSIEDDKRLAGLGRLRVKIRRACSRPA